MKSSLKSHLAVGLIRFVASLPRWFIEGPLARLAATLMWFANGDMRRVTEINLRQCFPDMPEDERDQLVRRSLLETIRTALELPSTWLKPVDQVLSSVKSVEGESLVKAALAEGKGIIFLSPHVGNWEVLGLYLGQHYHITSMYKPGRIEGIDELVKASRMKSGAQLAPTNRKGVMQLLRSLKNHGVVGILPDQSPDDDNGGIYAPIFAETALTMTLVPNLLQKANCVAIGCIAKRIEGGDYKIIFQSAHRDIYDTNLEIATAGLNRTSEALINLAPEQYQWEYKRFRRGPDGQKRHLYKKKS